MIVGGYVLHVYCDHCDKWQGRLDHNNDRVTGADFSGDSKQHSLRLARKRGWRINESKGTAMCPGCTKETLGAKAQTNGG